MNEQNNFIVKEDMICPITKVHCDDECCTVDSICNLSGNANKLNKPTLNELTEQDYKCLLALVNADIFNIQAEINNNNESVFSLEYLYETKVQMERLQKKLKTILNTF